MGWIMFVVLVSVIAGALLAVGFHWHRSTVPREVEWSQLVFIGAGIGWSVLILIGTGVSMLHQVPAGHVGVVYEFGGIVDQTGDGLVIVPPWRTVTNASTQLQTLCFTDEDTHCSDGANHVGEGLDSFSQETQNVFIDAIVNIRVSPDNVQQLYREVGPNYINKLVPGRIAQIFKDEMVNYTAVEIAPNRENIRASVERQLKAELAPYSIDVAALLIENVAFEPEFEQAIRDKQVATQNALREQENIKAEQARADQAIEQARGRAESVKVEALAQAEANRLLAESLTPAVIQFQALQKLSDNVRIALIPSGEGIIIDPATLLGTTDTADQ